MKRVFYLCFRGFASTSSAQSGIVEDAKGNNLYEGHTCLPKDAYGRHDGRFVVMNRYIAIWKWYRSFLMEIELTFSRCIITEVVQNFESRLWNCPACVWSTFSICRRVTGKMRVSWQVYLFSSYQVSYQVLSPPNAIHCCECPHTLCDPR